MQKNTFAMLKDSEYNEDYYWMSNLSDDYTRMHVPNDNWELCYLNKNYCLCDTYPKHIYVPARAPSEVLVRSASYRTNRLPVLTYLHTNEASITRCGQPTFLSNRCVEDENMLEAIQYTNSKAKYLQIVGAISENEKFYEKIKFKSLGIGNIHEMRASLKKMLLSDFDAETSSEWLKHIKSIMDTSFFIASAVSKGISVLVHCLTGCDHSSQVSAIAALMLDPFYRTIKGFRALIDKEFLAFGYKFNDRCGFNQGDPTEISPLFTQFIECIFQIMQENMPAFEFNEQFLLKLHDLIQSCQFPTFIGNSEKDRLDLKVWERKYSLWKYIANHLNDYINPSYVTQMHLIIRPNSYNGGVWRDIYRKFDESLLYLGHCISSKDLLQVNKVCTKRRISWETKKTILKINEYEWLHVFFTTN